MDIEQFLTNNTQAVAQLGFSVVFLLIYWYERKDNRENTRELKQAYKDNTKAFEELKSTIDSLKESQKNAIDNNTKSVDTLVTKMDSIFRNNNK